jgi:NitT/TauT family transport system substrate-binding protein
MVEGKDYTTVGIEGFDPLVHIKLPGIAGFPGYKSNEPGTLERAGSPSRCSTRRRTASPVVRRDLHQPGVRRTTTRRRRRTSSGVHAGHGGRGGRPDAAARRPVDLINANGNKNFLSPEGEQFRWTTESGW